MSLDAFAPASPIEPPGERRLRAFRATDAFALEAYRAAIGLSRSDGESLGVEIRRAVARSGGALVAAACSPVGGEGERRCLEAARAALAEARYFLYLARRLGVLDLKRYRALSAQQDAALREVDALVSRPGLPGCPRPP